MSELLERFAGCWRLVDYEFRTDDGKVFYPWGDDPVGIVINDGNGRFSAQIMRRDRPAFDSETPAAETMQSAYLGYMAYFGTAEVKEDEGIIINHVEGSLNPNWVGGEQIRYFEFKDGKKILRTPPTKIGGVEVSGTLTWERVE